MTATRKARYHQQLRYGQRIRYIPGIILPPSCAIALAHHIAPHVFPLMSRRQWKAKR